MFRIIAVFLALISPAFAQVATPDESLQGQLAPESFKLSGSAIATRPYAEWWTTVSYTLVNDSGMNLYIGLHHPKRLVDGGPLAGAPHGAGQAETVGRDPNAFKRDGGATGVSVGKEAGTPASTGAVFRRAAV
jgi:hypothetical protein